MNIIETSWNWRGGLSTRKSTDFIALHHAAVKNCSARDVDNWHKGNGWIGIGYHFFVRKDGTIYRGRPLWALGAHVGGSNHNSIGICAEGDYSTEKTMPFEQKLAIAELLNELKTYHYPLAKIVGHGELGASECPGKYYPLEEMKEYRKILNESEELSVTQYEELKRELADVKEKLAERTGYYNYIDENMNASYKPTIKKLVDAGIIKGNEKGELQLTNDMMRIIVFCDRMINGE